MTVLLSKHRVSIPSANCICHSKQMSVLSVEDISPKKTNGNQQTLKFGRFHAKQNFKP